MTDEEKREKITKLRADAERAHKMGDRKWEGGKKETAQVCHNDGARCTKEANELEATLAPPGPGLDSVPLRTCTKCKEPTRRAEKPHYVLPGTLTIHAFHRAEIGQLPRDHQESRRYCPACTLVVKDALMELGFTFLPENEDPPAVIHLNPAIEAVEAAVATFRAQSDSSIRGPIFTGRTNNEEEP